MGFFLVLCFLPETKGLALEELDDVFSVPTFEHAQYQLKGLWISIQRNILRQDVPKQPPLYKQQRMAVTNPEWNEKTEVSHIN